MSDKRPMLRDHDRPEADATTLDLDAALFALLRERVSELLSKGRAFGNLVARIDRDGGHAQAGRSVEENLARADAAVADLHLIADEFAETRDELVVVRFLAAGWRRLARELADDTQTVVEDVMGSRRRVAFSRAAKEITTLRAEVEKMRAALAELDARLQKGES